MPSICSRRCSSRSRGSGRGSMDNPVVSPLLPGEQATGIMLCFAMAEMTGRTAVMQLGLRSLQGDHEHLEKRFEPSLFKDLGGDGFTVVSPVALSLDIDRQDVNRYRLAGHLAGEVGLKCSRCLEPYRLRGTTALAP